MIFVNCIKCPICGEIIYSRARHDCQNCKCGAVYIDGGFDYVRVGGQASKVFKRGIKATRSELYSDWNLGEGKYGKIKD